MTPFCQMTWKILKICESLENDITSRFILFMFLLALLGCQAFASDSNWKGEAYVESNFFQPIDPFTMRRLFWWVSTVRSWAVPKGTTFDEKGLIEYIQKKIPWNIKSYQVRKTEVDGGVWIRGTAHGKYISAYWHPTKSHTAAVYSGGKGIVLPETPEIAEPGCWAVAFGNAGTGQRNFPVYRIIQ